MRALVLCVVSLFFAASGAAALTSNCTTAVSFVGNYRKDAYLPYDKFPEAKLPSPVHGGRIHVVANVSSTPMVSPVVGATVNSVPALGNLTAVDPTIKYLDWAKADTTGNTAWMAFHSRNTDWLPDGASTAPPMTITLTDSAGTCVTGTFTPTLSTMNITYVSPVTNVTSGPQLWVLHLHNFGAAAVAVPPVVFDGAAVATRPHTPATIQPNSHMVLTFNATHAKHRGEPFTVAVGDVANGGRTPMTRFPIEVWPRSTDCPLPTVNATAYGSLASHGIDATYVDYDDVKKKCNADLYTLIPKVGPAYDFHFWLTHSGVPGLPAAANPYVTAFCGDEVDGRLDSGLRAQMQKDATIRAATPTVLTYQGGKTNRQIGAYAGATDIQGVDAYIAGCAPTIVTVTSTLPLQYSYAYLLNARNNHYPLPTMSYSQLYGDWDVEPNGNELCVQIGSVLLAGAKGMTMFQSIQQYFDKESSDWNGNVQRLLLSVANPTVREVLRTGDIDGLAFESSDKGDPLFSTASVAQVIRSPKYIMLVVVNTDADGYSNLLCHVYVSDHWHFSDHTVKSITIQVSDDAVVTSDDVAGMMEAHNGQLVPAKTVSASLSGSTITVSDIVLSNDDTTRIFLIPYTPAD